MVSGEMLEEARRLKEERDAVVLAHYYVTPDAQDLADYVGDSFYLSRKAATLDCRTIVFAGVRFMAESAKLLSPDKTVLMPEPSADCPMAHMVRRETVDAARARYGGGSHHGDRSHRRPRPLRPRRRRLPWRSRSPMTSS